MPLRNYQQQLYNDTKQSLLKNRSTCMQLATGGGKTAVMASICESVFTKNKRAWIIVPRRELLNQSSQHLLKWNVPHGIINANSNESKAYKIHVVSKDTLIRRYDKIKNWPDLIMFDECHMYLDRQIEIVSHLPETSKVIGCTATPERLDGRGLNELYNGLVTGPSIPHLTERGFLAPLRYFSPPLEGLKDLNIKGNDYDEEQLEELLERRKIYGQLVGHYEKYGKGKAALIFCRSVKQAYQTAERFKDKGFNFHCIEGKMSARKLKDMLNAHRNGEIDGLTTCDLVLYGVDIPRVDYGASIRPTLSRALYMQMIGRVLRPFEGKEHALWFDHVNMVLEHQDDQFPGVPLHYVPEITWNFTGITKRKKKKLEKDIRLCAHLDFFYCAKPSCATCPHNPNKNTVDARQSMVVVDVALEEIKAIPLKDRPPEEKREFQDKIGACILDYKQEKPGAVEKMLEIADDCGYSVFWVYHQLNNDNKYAVNISLLGEIGKISGYKPGWVFFAKNKIKAGA